MCLGTRLPAPRRVGDHALKTLMPIRLAVSENFRWTADRQGFHGSRSEIPKSAKSFTLRVTRIKLWCRAVPASNPSKLGSGLPFSCRPAVIAAQRLPMDSSTGSNRPANHACRSRASHCSNCDRRLPGQQFDAEEDFGEGDDAGVKRFGIRCGEPLVYAIIRRTPCG
jgi:hypothetical protein